MREMISKQSRYALFRFVRLLQLRKKRESGRERNKVQHAPQIHPTDCAAFISLSMFNCDWMTNRCCCFLRLPCIHPEWIKKTPFDVLKNTPPVVGGAGSVACFRISTPNSSPKKYFRFKSKDDLYIFRPARSNGYASCKPKTNLWSTDGKLQDKRRKRSLMPVRQKATIEKTRNLQGGFMNWRSRELTSTTICAVALQLNLQYSAHFHPGRFFPLLQQVSPDVAEWRKWWTEKYRRKLPGIRLRSIRRRKSS